VGAYETLLNNNILYSIILFMTRFNISLVIGPNTTLIRLTILSWSPQVFSHYLNLHVVPRNVILHILLTRMHSIRYAKLTPPVSILIRNDWTGYLHVSKVTKRRSYFIIPLVEPSAKLSRNIWPMKVSESQPKMLWGSVKYMCHLKISGNVVRCRVVTIKRKADQRNSTFF